MRFKIINLGRLTAILLLAIIAPYHVWGSTFDIRISAKPNDAHEKSTDGKVEIDKNELILGENIIGLRFAGVLVPQGSTILSAYIEFTAKDNDVDATNLTIHGEAGDNAPEFVKDTFNTISNRAPTSAATSWNVPAWINDQTYQTPDLSAMVQEIINRDGGGVTSGWLVGNSMVFIFSGSGYRKAKSYDGDDELAPRLHIEYTSNSIVAQISSATDEANEKSDENVELQKDELKLGEKTIGLRFQGLAVPKGSIVTRAFIEFESKTNQNGATSLMIRGENGDNPPEFSDADANVTGRVTTSKFVDWNNLSPWETGIKYRSPDLSEVVQEIVSRSGWLEGNAMVFIFSGNGKREALSFHNDPAKAPVLFLEFLVNDETLIAVDTTELGAVPYVGTNAENAAFTVTNAGVGTLNATITYDADWVACSPANSALAAGESATITVTYNSSSLSIGIHEAHITVSDSDSKNKSVEIDVSLTVLARPVTQKEGLSCGQVPLYTESRVSPAIMVLLDVSGSMGWDIAVAGRDNPQSPDLSGMVQEIIDLADWQSGNPMSFIISGSGKRIARSYNGSSGSAPRMQVDYDYEGLSYSANFRVSQSGDDAEERNSDGHVNLDSTDLELINDGADPGGNQTVGIRFQQVTIPRGAFINTAYLEFVADESNSESTSLTIHGEKLANSPTFATTAHNISQRPATLASVAWHAGTQPPLLEWIAPTMQRRIEVGKAAISNLMEDPGIAWGFGTWTTNSTQGYTLDIDYTKIHAGCKPYSDEHQQALQDAITAAQPLSMTPLAPALLAAKKYFMGEKKDKEGAVDGETYVSIECQPKFLIMVTDGLGNTGTTLLNVEQYTNELSDQGVSVIALGFGIDNAVQIQKIAEVSNQRAHAAPAEVGLSSKLYALHEEVNGIGQPFLANSREELVEALAGITERIKNKIKYYGSAPAPTTSLDLGDVVIAAQFDPTDWSGDLEALAKSGSGAWETQIWRASEAMAAMSSPRKIFSLDVDHTTLKDITADYQVSTHCKLLGDIINSTPVVVGSPPFFYPYDGYDTWRRSVQRDPLIYVGANDGALHAFSLADGEEKWAFLPENLLTKFNAGATDPRFDQCSDQYCHQYFVDGSPQVADIYVNAHSSWKTILVCGQREGGTGYFALDVTSGKPFDDSTDPSGYFWEFTDSELGQTWADPGIERIKDETMSCTDAEGTPIACTTWGVFFGSGYDPAVQANKAAYMYGLEAHNKDALWRDADGYDTHGIRMAPYVRLSYDQLVKDFTVGQTVSGSPSGASGTVASIQVHDAQTGTLELENVTGAFQNDDSLTGDAGEHAKADGTLMDPLLNDALASPLVVDLDDDYIADHIYVGNSYGTMYRITAIDKGRTPVITKLFDFNPFRTSPHVNPIRSRATYAYGSYYDDAIWVYYGTGRYENQGDKANAGQQYFLGLKDSKSSPAAYNWDGSDSDPDIVKLSAKYVAHPDLGMVRYIDGTNEFNKSWVIQLDASVGMAGSERVIEKPLVVGGIVFFTTFIPDEDVCKGGGKTWVYALDYDSGLAATHPIFDLNADGIFDDQDKVVVDDVVYHVAGFMIGTGKGSHPVLQKDTLFISTSGSAASGGGRINGVQVNLPATKVNLESWKTK